MLTVLHYTDIHRYGGLAKHLELLLRELPAHGVESVLAMADLPELAMARAPIARSGVRIEDVTKLGAWTTKALEECRALIRKTRPAFLHAHLAFPGACRYAILAAKLEHVPVIATEHDPFPLSPLKRIAKKATVAMTAHTIAISDWAAQQVHRNFGVPIDRITRIWNGIDMAPFDAARAPASLAEFQRGFLLVENAELHHRKGIDVLLRALGEVRRSVPGTVLLVIGNGDRAEYASLAKRLGVGDVVRFLGLRDDVPDVLAACDVFVHAARREAFGLGVVEAMAAGKPVVVTDVGGLVDIVEDGRDGVRVPSDDPAALAAALIALGHDPARRTAYGASGRAKAHAVFTAERMAEETAALYHRLHDAIGD